MDIPRELGPVCAAKGEFTVRHTRARRRLEGNADLVG